MSTLNEISIQNIKSLFDPRALTKSYAQLSLLGSWNDKSKYGALIRVAGQESMSNLFEYELTLVTENKGIESEVFCNKKLGFAVQTPQHDVNQMPKEQRYYNGIIKCVSFLKEIYHEKKELYIYQLKLVPQLYQTTQVKRTNIFVKEAQTLIDVLKAVLKDYSIDPKFDLKDEKLFVAETCAQFNETDFDFITRLMGAAGFFYFFQHDKNDHKMIISNRPTAYFEIATPMKYSSEEGNTAIGVRDLKVQYNSYVKNFDIQAFNYGKCEELVKDSYVFEGHSKQDPLSVKSGQMLYMQKVEDKQEVQNIINNKATNIDNLPECIYGSSGYQDLAVGGKVKLESKIFSQMLEKKEYVISSLTIDIDDSEPAFYKNSFVAIPKDHVIRPIIKRKHFLGPHPAIVVNKEGKDSVEEPFVDKHGQVFTYVKLYWGTEHVCKALVITPFNTVNVPKPGALVNVGFLQNDSYADIAFIWGMHPPKITELLDYEQKEHNVLSLYSAFHTDKEKDFFNSILFKDKKDAQEIEIRAKKDHYSYITDMRQTFIGVDKREEVDGKDAGDKDITVLKKGNRREIICDGNDVLNVNKGDITITIKDGNYTLECKKKVTITAEDSIELTSKKTITFSCDEKIIMKAKGGFDITSPQDLKIDVNNMNTVTKGVHKVDSMSLNHSAKQAVGIKAGTELKAEGGVGATFKGGGTAKVEGGGMTEVKGGMVKVN